MATQMMQRQQAQPDAGQEVEGATELVIKIEPSGQISVYRETGEDEAGEQTAEQVGDIGQALSWCLREYKSLGTDGADALSDLQAGFGGPQPKPMMAG